MPVMDASGDSLPAGRQPALDALRGAAIVWMVSFHLAYDLNHFGWLQPPQQFLVDPFWTWQRVCIVSLFMFCAGAGQSMARLQAVPWPRFWRRWLQVVGCAALVSVATALVFGPRWISFGVLHGLAVMVLVSRLTAAWPPAVLLGLAVVALVLPQFVSHPVFDSRWLNGIGLVTHKPATEDYAPVLPWMGAVWAGVALGPRLFGASSTGPQRQGAVLLQPLAFLGRWPLTVYMLHQPLFWGVLLLLGPRATMPG